MNYNLDATKEPIQPLLMQNDYENQLIYGDIRGVSGFQSNNFLLGYNASSDHLYQETMKPSLQNEDDEFFRSQLHHHFQMHQQQMNAAVGEYDMGNNQSWRDDALMVKILSSDQREQQIIDESFKILEEFKQDQAALAMMQGGTYHHNYLQDFDFTDPITPMESTQEEDLLPNFG